MSGKWKILFWLITFSLIGGIVSILIIPDLANHLFWMGLLVGIFTISLGIALANLIEQTPKAKRFMGKLLEIPISTSGFKTNLYTRLILLSATMLFSAVIGFMVYRQTTFITANNALQQQEYTHHREMIEAIQLGEQLHLVHSVINALEKELTISDTISDQMCGRIIVLSKNLNPYHIWQGDSLSAKKFSPERGLLLVSLLQLQIDSVSWQRIKREADFSKAKLTNSILDDTDLSDINLQGADLYSAQINHANLSNAKLQACILSNSSIQNSVLAHANLEYAQLNWANLSHSTIVHANLNATVLSNAKLNFSNLSHSEIKWANMASSSLKNCLLNESVIYGSNLQRAILVNSQMNSTNLSLVNLEDADLTGATIEQLGVGEEIWFDKLSTWNVAGRQMLLSEYSIAKDTSGRFVYVVNRIPGKLVE